jgi:hypothetical protein
VSAAAMNSSAVILPYRFESNDTERTYGKEKESEHEFDHILSKAVMSFGPTRERSEDLPQGICAVK